MLCIYNIYSVCIGIFDKLSTDFFSCNLFNKNMKINTESFKIWSSHKKFLCKAPRTRIDNKVIFFNQVLIEYLTIINWKIIKIVIQSILKIIIKL